MDLAFITPTAYLEKFASQGDFYLALAHLIDDNGTNQYATFHRRAVEQGKRVILDNGLFEGAQVSTDELLRRAVAIKAHTVCAPDVLYDSKGTIKEFKQFIKAKHEAGLVFNVMGIPQADNRADWWDCWQYMQQTPECHIIGLSILSIPKSFRSPNQEQPITSARVHLIRQLYSLSDISGTRLKPMHLLGLGESYDDIKAANELLSRDIISNDSSSCFVHGMNRVIYREDGVIPGGKIKNKLDFDLKLARPQILKGPNVRTVEHIIQDNIDIAKVIVCGD